MTERRSLSDYLSLQYPFQVLADPDGGYIVVFPDLPGCSTHAETIDEIPVMAEGARRLWITGEYEDGHDIPLPSYPEEYSGKFNVRLPRSLHRALAEGARRNGVSLNQYVETLLAQGDVHNRVESRLEELESRLTRRLSGLSEQVEHLGRRLHLAESQAHEGPALAAFITAQRQARHVKRRSEDDALAEYAVMVAGAGAV